MKKQKEAQRGKPSLFKEVWFVSLAVILGIILLLYPVVATQANNIRQQQISSAYSDNVEELPGGKAEAEEIVRKAQKYNHDNAAGPIIDPWSARVSSDNKIYQEYIAQLNTLPEMSQVVIPSINVNLPVYHGTEDETLAKGLGHLFGTALPVGGLNTHAVITGHSGMSDHTMFDNLPNMKVGDAIYINTYGEKMKYEVINTEVVLPEETDSLWPQPDKDLITLITCTPYGVNTHRLLVHAHRVPLDEEDQEAFDKFVFPPLQWWMMLFIAIACIAIILLVLWIDRVNKRLKNNAGKTTPHKPIKRDKRKK